MAKLNVTLQCMAVYNSTIVVPDGATMEEAIVYATESDVLDEENCDLE